MELVSSVSLVGVQAGMSRTRINGGNSGEPYVEQCRSIPSLALKEGMEGAAETVLNRPKWPSMMMERALLVVADRFSHPASGMFFVH